MAKVIVAEKKIDCQHLLGQWAGEEHYDHVVDYDCDFFTPPTCSIVDKACCEQDCGNCDIGRDEDRCGFIFRKGHFTKEEQLGAFRGLEPAVQATSNNRGLASGPKIEKVGNRDWLKPFQEAVLKEMMKGKASLPGLDPIQDLIEQNVAGKIKDSGKGCMWLYGTTKRDNFKWDEWFKSVKDLPVEERKIEATGVFNEYVSVTSYANPVHSSVAGFYDSYPRFPFARAVAYNRDNPEQFALSFPFLQSLSRAFQKELPKRWSNQKAACDRTAPEFIIPGTVFSTITVNKTFRTSCHLDAGDLESGFSNLSVLTDGEHDYTGGYLVLPEYRTAINIRPGDLLLIANHNVIHGNTPIDGHRISIVAYYREGLLKAGTYEYETAKFDFIEGRRLNKDDPRQYPQWTGVTPNWITSQEWYDFLENRLGREKLLQYHPEVKGFTGATLW